MQKNSNQHQTVSARIEKSKNYSLKKNMFHKIKTKKIPCVSKDITLGWRITKRLIPLQPELILLSSYPYTTSHQHVYSPCCSLHISYGTNKDNSFENQELLQLVIISPYCHDLIVSFRSVAVWRN